MVIRRPCVTALVCILRSKGIITGAACALALRRRGRVLVVGAGPDVVLLFWCGHELAPAAGRAEKGCRAGGVLLILLPYCAPPPAHQAALGAPRALPAQPGSGCTVSAAHAPGSVGARRPEARPPALRPTQALAAAPRLGRRLQDLKPGPRHSNQDH